MSDQIDTGSTPEDNQSTTVSESTEELALSLIKSPHPIDFSGPESCISHFQGFATSPLTTERTHQLTASLLWLRSAQTHKHDSLLSAYTHLAGLLERLPTLGLDIWARKEVLDRLPTDLATSAARCALGLDNLELAVTLVDKLRGLSWGQILHTLAPAAETDRLIKEYPSLGIPLRGYLRALYTGSLTHRARSLRTDPRITQQEIDAHIDIAESVDELLVQIRDLPGYQHFLKPDPLANARKLAKYGHVVMLIPDATCTHLIYLKKGDGQVRSASIHGLNLEESHRMAQEMKIVLGQAGLSTRGTNLDNIETTPTEELTERGFTIHPGMSFAQYLNRELECVLSLLWDTVGLAVKNLFQLERNLCHKVYLYPTGPLSNLPIHAACKRGEALLDYIIPSYIPSFQHLAFPSDTIAQDPPHVLVISQPNTPGQSLLPCTTIEVTEIKKFVPLERLQVYEREKGDKSALLNVSYELARTNPLILHLACHAKQVPCDPFQSAFFLYDGQVPMSSLLWSQKDRPVLAVLSACETAAADEVRPDEFLHIGASMHCMKKFPAVVATLWAISDSDGPSMAEALYEAMFKTGLDSASGLRIAANRMRSKQVPPVRWVPFVHFGI
ncbi:unnamed protein product [Rhizoctonia solani]|uniref:CHAT domain-containing protein n=1 Tax=Rhizoctonia solani TaxID=456999 RepID=A0A8H2W7C2_9AGAM|nr:unnamed protein product [Rhizoctonia solani]